MTTFEAIRVELARARAAGEDFDAAWRAATREVRDKDTRAALFHTRPAWRAAYQGEPPAGPVLALAALAVDPDREPLPDGADGRSCEHCRELIPAARSAKARFCSDRCRRDASRVRAVAA